jgi:hypothetical protein
LSYPDLITLIKLDDHVKWIPLEQHGADGENGLHDKTVVTAHPASHPMGTGNKSPEREADYSTPNAKVNNAWNIASTPSSSGHGA